MVNFEDTFKVWSFSEQLQSDDNKRHQRQKQSKSDEQLRMSFVPTELAFPHIWSPDNSERNKEDKMNEDPQAACMLGCILEANLLL